MPSGVCGLLITHLIRIFSPPLMGEELTNGLIIVLT
jgi:hypothetical protein